jgi:PEP-CTERM motif
LYFSYSTGSIIEEGPGVYRAPFIGFFGFVSDTLSITTTLTGTEGPRLRIDEGTTTATAPNDDLSFWATVGGIWNISIAGVQTVDQPADTFFSIRLNAAYPSTTFQAGVLSSATAIGPGADLNQRDYFSGLALNNGVPMQYTQSNDLVFSRGTGIVITSTGGNVPEPSVLALLAIAAAGAGLASKRRAP